jgi:hypothetical protein
VISATFGTQTDIQVLSHDTLPYVRVQGLHVIFQLLAGNAEQEQNLLRLGINKLVSQLDGPRSRADSLG